MSFQVSYAQNKEDFIIDAFFPDVEKGFYVDVGANDPDEDSVTKLFYMRGWAGINIEPLPSKYALLQKKRKRDINIQCGLSDKKGRMTFREYAGHGLSTFSQAMKDEHASHPNNNVESYNDFEVPMMTLTSIVKEHGVEHVHFMKIDVEGFEFYVLKGNDWERNRPELICIEANHISDDWQSYLESQRYLHVFHDGLNAYYLRNESIWRLEQFSYADKLLAGAQIIKWTVKKEFDLITKNYEENTKSLKHSLAIKVKENDELWLENQELQKAYRESIRAKNIIRRLVKTWIGRA